MPVSRRMPARAALCLTLGLLTTIAVAWAFAAYRSPQRVRASSSSMRVGDGSITFGVYQWSFRGVDRIWWGKEARGGVDLLVLPTGPVQCSDDELRAFASEQRFPRWWDPAARSPITRSTLDLDSTLRDARGWPFVALWCEWASEAAIDASVVSGGVRLDPAPLPGGLVGSTIFHVRALPCRPIPLGLIADTLFYAALWSAILFAPLALRTHVRRRRNHCPRCNYDLRATSPGSPCPECGRLTIPRKRV